MSEKYPWFTGDGDDGSTGLLGSGRVAKYHPQPESFGTVDEATSSIGYARSLVQDEESSEILLRTQRDCYHMMAELAATSDAQLQFRVINDEHVEWVAQKTNEIGDRITLPREFIVPGDTQSGAALDVARTVVRRAERQVTKLLHDDLIENQQLVRYLNRLSSLLFVLARYQDALSREGAVTLAKEAIS